jgi:hypothetical protein
MGEMKEAVQCFVSSSTQRSKATDGDERCNSTRSGGAAQLRRRKEMTLGGPTWAGVGPTT